MRNSSISSKKTASEGNTKQTPKKQVSPAKYWCFTLNNYTNTEVSSITLLCETYVGIFEYVVGYEVGDSGTPHLQGFVSFETKTRPMGIFENKRIHWEKCKAGRNANMMYCTKCENIMITNMKIPKKLKLITYDMLRPWQLKIIDMVKEVPSDRLIFWYWGAQEIGKTSFQKYLAFHYEAIVLEGSCADMKNGIVSYKAHCGVTPEIVVSNLPYNTDMYNLSYRGYETIKDMFFYSGKYEGAMIHGNHPHLLIFSNDPPDTNNAKFIVEKIT